MDKDPVVVISPVFKGAITLADLLTSEGTLLFVTNPISIRGSGYLFQILYNDFIFCLSIQNSSVVFQRNKTISVLTLDELVEENRPIMICAAWSHYELILDCMAGKDCKRVVIPTIPTAPPSQLIKWVRKHNLLPIITYRSEDEFREKIHASLITINQKIRESDAYKSFWNITYEGNKIIDRQPKKEVEIQPLIHCFLVDQMLLGNIEIIPEYKTGEGNLDFLLVGQVDCVGACKFCAEFKLAHSDDLEEGLWYQLPKYMDACNATYGAYCVFNYKGDWFNKPKLKRGETLEMHLAMYPNYARKPVHENIRSFIFDFGKPATASQIY